MGHVDISGIRYLLPDGRVLLDDVSLRVGEGAKIGASAVVLKEVPPYCTVVGNPGRVVRMGTKKVEIDLDQVHLPDPVKERILSLTARVDELEKCMGCASCEKDASCTEREACARAMKEENRNEDL